MRRKFRDAHEQSTKLISWILHQIALLYQIEERLREAKAGPAQRAAVRSAESRMIHKHLHKALIKLSARQILPRSKLGKAITYALNQWQTLEVYLTEGLVEIDNWVRTSNQNPTRSVRPNLARKTGCL